MSYKCQKCGEAQSESGSEPRRVVVETRNRTYPTGHVGTEIAKEQIMCPVCAAKAEVLARAALAIAKLDESTLGTLGDVVKLD